MHVGRYKLVFASIVCNGLEQCAASLIVKNVDVRRCVATFEAFKEYVVCRYSVGISFCLEGLN